MSLIANTDYTADLYAKLGGSSAKSAGGGAVQDMETRFLTLLMAQMRNQDPLNPLDNAQVTTQLAQLSTVTGIEKLNENMSRLLAGYNEAQAMQAASMVGRSVMIAGNKLPMAEGQSIGGIGLASPADHVEITIKDASGKIVQVVDLGAQEAGNSYFTWDGEDADGNVLPNGNYSFSVKASLGGQPVEATTMQIGMVSAVTLAREGFLLDMGSFGKVAFNDVLQIF